jgi:acetoacetyl-CoA reductase
MKTGQTNYSASKAGGLGFTKALALESARSGIGQRGLSRLYRDRDGEGGAAGDPDKNILPQIPLGRLGEPDEVARCVVFLAADDAGLITGSTLSATVARMV